MRRVVLAMGVILGSATTVSAQVPTPDTSMDVRLQPWQAYIDEAALRFNLPKDWIGRVILAESGGQTRRDGRSIRSAAGAIGLMQLMPNTYVDMRLAHNLGADPDDPHDNILAGSAYLRAMFDRYGYPGLFAAYNAGPTRYEANLRGVPLPAETQAYVAKLTVPARTLPLRPGLFIALSEGGRPGHAEGASAIFISVSHGQMALDGVAPPVTDEQPTPEEGDESVGGRR
jgi:hypothetical protein